MAFVLNTTPPDKFWASVYYEPVVPDNIRWALRGGLTVSPEQLEQMPKGGLWEDHKKKPADVLRFIDPVVVSERFKATVELLEPGTHQFIPFQLWMEDRENSKLNYHILNIRTRIDAMDLDRSTVNKQQIPGKPGTFVASVMYAERNKLLLKHPLIAGHHLWMGILHCPGRVLISDKLKEALEGVPLEPPCFLPWCTEVD